MINKGYTKKEVLDVLFDSEQEKERRRILAIVTKTVDALRLKNLREFLAYQQLATWRRVNGFDRGVEGEESCFNGRRSLPPTPQENYTGLWSEVNALKAAISMAAEDTMTRPWQKTIDFVDGSKGKLPDEELAVIKRYVEKLSREAPQVQMTVTQVDTVQYCSLCSPDPKPSPDACVNLENNEGRMDPEMLEELKSSSAGTGLKTPGQQGPPNEGTWEQGRTTANGFLTAGVDSNQGGRIPSPLERSTSTRTFADIVSTAAIQENRRRKTPSQHNKQFDPGGRGEKAPPWKVAVTLPSFSGESWKAPCLFSVCASCSVLCVCLFFFSKLLIYPGDTSQQAERYERVKDQVADVRNRRASIFSPITLLKMARTSNTRFGRSANALG